MALAYAEAVRNARLDAITALIDAGLGVGTIKIYDGARPATGGAITDQTLLGTVLFQDPAFPAATSGSMSANTLTDDSAADATGTATWFRVLDSNDTFILDGNVGTAGADLNLNSTSIVAGAPISITQFDLTAGNA